MLVNKYNTTAAAAILWLLTGCATQPPVYSAPITLVDKALVKFDLSSSFPITVGQVFLFEGDSCEGQPPNVQRLFVRGRGNPLVSDVNIDGVWLAANKTVNLLARAITTGHHMCAANGKFTPRTGVNYELRLTQIRQDLSIYDRTPDICTLQVYEVGTPAVLSKDFSIYMCQEKQ